MDKIHKFVEENFQLSTELFTTNSRFLKFVWAVLLLFCTFMVILHTRTSWLNYYSIPTLTQMTREFSNENLFPPILFCPAKWVNESKAKKMNFSQSALQYSFSLLPDVTITYDYETPIEVARDEFLLKFNNTELASYFLSISIDGEKVMNCSICQTWPPRKQFTAAGVCYDLKFPPVNSLSMFWEKALLMYNEIETSEFDNLQYTPYFNTYGLVNLGAHPNDTWITDDVLVPFGDVTIVSIHKSLHKVLNERGSHCNDSKQYSRNMCMSDCEQHAMIRCGNCGELGYFLNSRQMQSVTLCDIVTYAQRKSCDVKNDYKFVECVQKCIPRCEEMQFDTRTDKINMRHFVDEITGDAQYDAVIKFEFPTQNGMHVYNEISTYSWDEFMSNIGGLVGLWLGTSIVSLFQIIHLAISIAYQKCFAKLDAK